MSRLLVLILKTCTKINPTFPPDLACYRVALSLHGGEAVAVRFVAVRLTVVQRLQLLSGGPLVSVRFFPNKLSAVVIKVTWQQEASQ